jgi:hypothetical protein
MYVYCAIKQHPYLQLDTSVQTELLVRTREHRLKSHPDRRQFMPFGLANASATFQAYINKALHGLVDVFCV